MIPLANYRSNMCDRPKYPALVKVCNKRHSQTWIWLVGGGFFGPPPKQERSHAWSLRYYEPGNWGEVTSLVEIPSNLYFVVGYEHGSIRIWSLGILEDVEVFMQID